MSKPRSKEKSLKPKSTLNFFFKHEKRDMEKKKVVDSQYIVGASGVLIKHFQKDGEKSEKVLIKSQPSGKYLLTIFKDGVKEKESEHTVDEIKKYIEKNKSLAFFDQPKSLALVKKGGAKKRKVASKEKKGSKAKKPAAKKAKSKAKSKPKRKSKAKSKKK